MKNLLLALFGLFGALFFLFPMPVVFVALALAMYNKIVVALFCLLFAWNIARFVEHKYEQHLEDKDEDL